MQTITDTCDRHLLAAPRLPTAIGPVWAHLHDALDEIGLSIVPVGAPQPTGPAQPSTGRPSPPPRTSWFVDSRRRWPQRSSPR